MIRDLTIAVVYALTVCLAGIYASGQINVLLFRISEALSLWRF